MRSIKPGFHSNASACVGKQPIMVATASTEHSYWLALLFVAWNFSRNKRKRQPIGMLGRSSGNHDWLLANASACVSCGYSFTQHTQRKRLRLNGNRTWIYVWQYFTDVISVVQVWRCGSCSPTGRGRTRTCVLKTFLTCWRRASVYRSRQSVQLTSTWLWLNVSRPISLNVLCVKCLLTTASMSPGICSVLCTTSPLQLDQWCIMFLVADG